MIKPPYIVISISDKSFLSFFIERLKLLLTVTGFIFNKGTAITFGAYTGETEKTQDKALAKYKKLNDNAEPLPNELISREVMMENK